MSFGGLLNGNSSGATAAVDSFGGATAGMPAGVMSQSRLLPPSLSGPMFSSPSLSLALQTNLESGGVSLGAEEMFRQMADAGDFDPSGGSEFISGHGFASKRDDENESRSGSDNVEGGSGDDIDPENPPKKKRYHRHTPWQIQELESLFKECPHPDEKQRQELSKKLSLDSRQVKFWFQNRRTQMKTQLERHENALLKQENEKLKMDNMHIRESMRNPMCQNCGGTAALGQVSIEQQQLRLENARLRDELDRVTALAGRFIGRPVGGLVGHLPHHLRDSSLELAVGGNGFAGLCPIPPVPDYAASISSAMALAVAPPVRAAAAPGDMDRSLERHMLVELALTAMDELVKMAQMDEPLWVRDAGGRPALNKDEYARVSSHCLGASPVGFVSEATRETAIVIINSSALVETLMDSNRWPDMFPSMIAKTSTTDVIYVGMGGTRNGTLQLMRAELQVLSPLVPIREVHFLRFCKEHAPGVWAVVDVSVEGMKAGGSSASCRRLPSGCLVQDMPNGYSKVTWVEHAEYDESGVHLLYRPLLRSGMALGAQRWVATLQRQCECLAVLMSSVLSNRELPMTGITAVGRRSMLKLAQRMTANFCAGVCASSVHSWSKLSMGAVGEDVRVMTRKSENDPGEPPGVVLSAATSVWLPCPPHRVFDFLRNESFRSEWDILSNGGPMQEMAHIAKGQDQGNAVSLLRASAGGANQSSMLILQETCTDAAGSLVVYAPVDIPAMHLVMNGGDSSCVALLPSGFAISPDGPDFRGAPRLDGSGSPPQPSGGGGGGCLLTVAFQILVNSLPTATLTVESVETVNNLISCTVQKIKAALPCDAVPPKLNKPGFTSSAR
ncbi:homeobox-leucine zipper protein HDG1-like [Wolffia australiana]